MNEKRFKLDSELYEIYDYDKLMALKEVVDCLNEQQVTIEQLRTQLLICQQSKSDDGRFQVWEVPPIPKGMRITTSDGEMMSEKRFRFEKECTENFLTEKGVFYNNERPMGANEIIALLNSLSEENEQLRQQLQEYKENWDDMVESATKTSLRNVELDEQIGQLKAKLREKEQDERLYANEIVKLNKEAKEVLDFKSLGGDY